MNLIKFDPFTRPNRYMPGVFDDFFGRGLTERVGVDFSTNMPSVNVTEHPDNFLVEVAAPGLTKEDFKVAAEKNRLTISAEKSAENEKNEGKLMRREFNYSAFTRSFVLPETVDKEQITAAYVDGVLKLTLPKKPEVVKSEQSRVIEIA